MLIVLIFGKGNLTVPLYCCRCLLEWSQWRKWAKRKNIFQLSVFISNVVNMNWCNPHKQTRLQPSITVKSTNGACTKILENRFQIPCFASAWRSCINVELRGSRKYLWIFRIKATFWLCPEWKGTFVSLYAAQNLH